MSLCFSSEPNRTEEFPQGLKPPFALLEMSELKLRPLKQSSLRSEKARRLRRRGVAFPRGFGEDFGDVAFHFDAVPNAFEFAIGADQERAADDAEERAAKEFFHAARAIRLDRFQVGIA